MSLPLIERHPTPIRTLLFNINVNDLFCSILSILIFAALSFVPPRTLYIPPNDPMSSFPYKTDLISSVIMYCIIFPGAWVFLVVFYLLSRHVKSKFRYIHFWTTLWLHIIITMLTLSLSTVINIWVGRVRPDYFARCGPNVSPNDCDILNRKQLAEEKKSFPSSDAAAAMSSMSYLSLVLAKMCKQRPGWVTSVCLLFVVFAFFLGASRIKDYKAHCDDVVSGYLIGFTMCAFVWFGAYQRIFRHIKDEPSEVPSD